MQHTQIACCWCNLMLDITGVPFTGMREHNGTRTWYLNGQPHREVDAAIEYADGSKHWCIAGRLHRIDAPAIMRANGDEYWYTHGELHRLDGPAIEYASGATLWYLYGVKYPTFAEYADAAGLTGAEQTLFLLRWK